MKIVKFVRPRKLQNTFNAMATWVLNNVLECLKMVEDDRNM